jgi:hypothetical protein
MLLRAALSLYRAWPWVNQIKDPFARTKLLFYLVQCFSGISVIVQCYFLFVRKGMQYSLAARLFLVLGFASHFPMFVLVLQMWLMTIPRGHLSAASRLRKINVGIGTVRISQIIALFCFIEMFLAGSLGFLQLPRPPSQEDDPQDGPTVALAKRQFWAELAFKVLMLSAVAWTAVIGPFMLWVNSTLVKHLTQLIDVSPISAKNLKAPRAKMIRIFWLNVISIVFCLSCFLGAVVWNTITIRIHAVFLPVSMMGGLIILGSTFVFTFSPSKGEEKGSEGAGTTGTGVPGVPAKKKKKDKYEFKSGRIPGEKPRIPTLPAKKSSMDAATTTKKPDNLLPSPSAANGGGAANSVLDPNGEPKTESASALAAGGGTRTDGGVGGGAASKRFGAIRGDSNDEDGAARHNNNAEISNVEFVRSVLSRCSDSDEDEESNNRSRHSKITRDSVSESVPDAATRALEQIRNVGPSYRTLPAAGSTRNVAPVARTDTKTATQAANGHRRMESGPAFAVPAASSAKKGRVTRFFRRGSSSGDDENDSDHGGELLDEGEFIASGSSSSDDDYSEPASPVAQQHPVLKRMGTVRRITKPARSVFVRYTASGKQVRMRVKPTGAAAAAATLAATEVLPFPAVVSSKAAEMLGVGQSHSNSKQSTPLFRSTPQTGTPKTSGSPLRPTIASALAASNTMTSLRVPGGAVVGTVQRVAITPLFGSLPTAASPTPPRSGGPNGPGPTSIALGVGITAADSGRQPPRSGAASKPGDFLSAGPLGSSSALFDDTVEALISPDYAAAAAVHAALNKRMSKQLGGIIAGGGVGKERMSLPGGASPSPSRSSSTPDAGAHTPADAPTPVSPGGGGTPRTPLASKLPPAGQPVRPDLKPRGQLGIDVGSGSSTPELSIGNQASAPLTLSNEPVFNLGTGAPPMSALPPQESATAQPNPSPPPQPAAARQSHSRAHSGTHHAPARATSPLLAHQRGSPPLGERSTSPIVGAASPRAARRLESRHGRSESLGGGIALQAPAVQAAQGARPDSRHGRTSSGGFISPSGQPGASTTAGTTSGSSSDNSDTSVNSRWSQPHHHHAVNPPLQPNAGHAPPGTPSKGGRPPYLQQGSVMSRSDAPPVLSPQQTLSSVTDGRSGNTLLSPSQHGASTTLRASSHSRNPSGHIDLSQLGRAVMCPSPPLVADRNVEWPKQSSVERTLAELTHGKMGDSPRTMANRQQQPHASSDSMPRRRLDRADAF